MIHLQLPVNNWLDSVKLLPDRSLVKTIDDAGVFKEVKAINPNIYTCLRHWYDPGQVFGGTYEENKHRARTFLDTFIDGTFVTHIAPYCDFIEEWNEYLASSHNQAEIDVRLRWAEAVADVWLNEFRNQHPEPSLSHRYHPELSHIRLVLCNTAIGNNIAKGFFALANSYDCLLGYHAYSHWSNYSGEYLRAANDWVDLSGRWHQMETDYGIKVDWIFTEAGPFESAVDGWRSPNCLNHSVNRYNTALTDWIGDVVETPAFQEGRVYGFGFFTTGRTSDTWKHYWTEQPTLNTLAATTNTLWKNPPPKPPPKPPPQPPTHGKPRVQYKRVFNVISELATDSEAAAIFLSAWRRGRETVGGSYDDAGVGDLNDKTARLYGIPTNNRQIYLNWYATYYPNTNVIFLPTLSPSLNFIWPVDNSIHIVTIDGHFNAPRTYGLHEGLDLFTDLGDPILAAADGEVVWADYRRRRDMADSDYGNHIIIAHALGFTTWYGHLKSYSVTEGQLVIQGDHIGKAGSTGKSTGPHLHFAMQRLDHGLPGYVISDAIDPGPFLNI